MTLERSNKVTNVGRVKFTKLVLDVLPQFTLEKLHMPSLESSSK
jgi:hypothetical protein